MHYTTYVGLDVHKDNISVAVTRKIKRNPPGGSGIIGRKKLKPVDVQL